MCLIQLRFNTMVTPDSDLCWRLLIDGVEHLVSHVEMQVPVYTSKDLIPGVGEKWHISAQAREVIFEGSKAIVL